MSHNGKLIPNLDQNSTKILNLTVLQRIDPFIEEILITAAHVTFYEFNIELSQWSRKDVEGSLFVVKRNTQPRFQFIVMNRRSTNNLVENLLGDFEYEVQIPYLLYRNAAQEVNGIWFYNKNECEEVSNLFGRILGAYSKVPLKPKVVSTKSDFEALEGVPTMAVIDGPLEPSSTMNNSTVTTDIPSDPSFINYFSSAMNVGGSSSSSSSLASNAIPTVSSSSSVPMMQAAMPMTLPLMDTGIEFSGTTASRGASNLVKPSSFFVQPPHMLLPTVSSPAPPTHNHHHHHHHPLVNLQRPYGAPLLQPFPPPTPPLSLTPTHVTPIISREKVRDALAFLVQDNQFIDMVYRAVLSTHNS